MSLDVGTIVEVKQIDRMAFHDTIPYVGFYLNTLADTTLELGQGWISLSTSSPHIKVFTDSDVMKRKRYNLLRSSDRRNLIRLVGSY